MPTSAARDLVFVSYSHANPDWRDKLLLLLKPFVRQGRLQVWADPDPYIRTGDIWRRTIDEALARTRVGVVLLTPDLLASDFVAEVEVPSLLRAAHARDLILVVVPIEPLVEGSTRFPDGDLKQFQWPWTPEEPIAELDDRRQMRALVTVANAIVASAVSEEPLPAESATIERRSTTSVLTPSDRLGGLYGVPPFPPHYIPRVREHEMLKDAVVGEKTVIGVSAGGMRVGVHGQGGLGKSVLAVSVAHDERVRRMFPDGVFWIPIGQQPDIASLQAYLAEQFGESAGIGDEATGTRVLKKRLDGKACLIVLDDVWRLIHVKAFDVLDAPIARVAARPVPMPYNDSLERATIPSQADIVAAVRGLM